MLGDFAHVGYYSDDMKPDTMDADFLLVEESRVDEVEKALKNAYFTTDLQLRDGQDSSKLYLDADKFEPLFPGQEPDFDPGSDEPAAASSSPAPAATPAKSAAAVPSKP